MEKEVKKGSKEVKKTEKCDHDDDDDVILINYQSNKGVKHGKSIIHMVDADQSKGYKYKNKNK